MEYIWGLGMQVIHRKSTLTFLSPQALDPLFHIMQKTSGIPRLLNVGDLCFSQPTK